MKEIEKLHIRPFTRFCMSIGAVPSSYLAGLTIEEQLLWLCSYLEKEVIPAVNGNAEAVEELQNLYVELKSYVDDYFDNLDVQEEINNKLDEMADDGTLQEIITEYINLKSILCYNSVAEMKAATNLTDGSFARTLGYYSYNDHGGALYKIREVTNQDTEDDMIIIALADTNLVAELVTNGEGNVHQFGAKGDGVSDDYTAINTAIQYLNVTNFVGGKTYLINTKLQFTNLNNKVINGNNSMIKYIDGTLSTDVIFAIFDLLSCSNININDLTLNVNGDWVMRPHVDYGAYSSTDPDFLAWKDKRNKTYDGLVIKDSSNIKVTNIISLNCRAGFYIYASENIYLNKCVSQKTFADGIYICSSSKYIYVNNHYCEDTGDDCYSADGWEESAPSYVYFTDCYALRSGGGLLCADSSKHISYTNIYGEEINYSPFKYEANYNDAEDINLYNVHAKTVANPELGYQTAYTTGTQTSTYDLSNIFIQDSSIEYTGPSTRRIEWIHRNINGIKYLNCKIIGITPYFTMNTTNVTLENCYFETQDAMGFEDFVNADIRNCYINNKCYFSARGHYGLLLTRVTNIKLNNNTYQIDTAETHYDLYIPTSGTSNCIFDSSNLGAYYGNISNIEFTKPLTNSYFIPSCKDYQLAISNSKVGYAYNGAFVGPS